MYVPTLQTFQLGEVKKEMWILQMQKNSYNFELIATKVIHKEQEILLTYNVPII